MNGKTTPQLTEDSVLVPIDTDEGPHPWLRVHKERCIAEQVDLHRDFAKAIAELVKQERTVGDDTAYVAALAEVFRLFNAAMRFHKEK